MINSKSSLAPSRTKVKRNIAVCLACGEILESKHRHDYVTCKCPNRSSVDGGTDYCKYSAVFPEFLWGASSIKSATAKSKEVLKQPKTLKERQRAAEIKTCQVRLAQLQAEVKPADGETTYRLDGIPTSVGCLFSEDELEAVEAGEATTPKFRVGQQVVIQDQYYKWCRGEIIRVVSDTRCLVKVIRDDGPPITIQFPNDILQLVNSETELDDGALKWAEGLIKQLPQTHGGRNSWLKNYASEEYETLNSESAVAMLLGHKNVIHIQYPDGVVMTCPENMEVEQIQARMKAGAVFKWKVKAKPNA